jgi:hypothetical protein
LHALPRFEIKIDLLDGVIAAKNMPGAFGFKFRSGDLNQAAGAIVNLQPVGLSGLDHQRDLAEGAGI